MSETLKKPYEISIWEDQVVTESNREDENTYYKEVKLAVIGSDTMTAPNRVYSPVLTENVNGEVTLTFSLYYRYYDEMVGDFVVNPFAGYLVNERKVKLKYNNKWYDLVIKECEEDSEQMLFSYTATSAFVQELSKNGYGITFSTDLNNNQGTIIELAKKTLKNTDWEVDEEDSDILIQTISEPIYKCKVDSDFVVKKLDTNSNITIHKNEIIYVFYSYIKNRVSDYVQFIREADKESWTFDSNDSINSVNYRFEGTATYTVNEQTQVCTAISFDGAAATVYNVDTQHQAYRLVYNQRTTYDPIGERTVDIYKAQYTYDYQEIYHYRDAEYSTSSLVNSYITNGTMNSVYSSDTINGWSHLNWIDNGATTLPALSIETNYSNNNKPLRLNQMTDLVAYLRMDFRRSPGSSWGNTIYNSGIQNNGSIIGSIAAGAPYVLRFRAKPIGNSSITHLKAVVAKYTYVEQSIGDSIQTVKKIDPNNIYFEFFSHDNEVVNLQTGNNIITGGTIVNNNYIINDVIQTPSRQYLYRVGNTYYYYDFNSGRYKPKDSNFIDYRFMVAKALKPIPKSTLTNSADPIGIFFFSNNGAESFLVEEVQFFKYVEDKNKQVVFPGGAPEAEIKMMDYYYLKPDENTSKDEINLYTTLESIAGYLAIDKKDIKPVQNENCEKILSINEEKSNCFNILQSLCETFECWLKINVEHDENGAIALDAKTRKPIKKIAFKEYIGRDNFSGFRYGVNLQSIQRSIDSTEFVSKLIVNQPASEYTDSGMISITDAKSNPSGESYILNFNYYINQKLIQNPDEFNADVHKFNLELSKLNNSIKNKNAELFNVKNAFEKAQAAMNVYMASYEAAQQAYAEALANFATVVEPYDSFIQKYGEDTTILEESTTKSLYDDVCSAAAELNKYGGLLTNVKKEYETLKLKHKGAQTYTITVSTTSGTRLTLSDYIEGFKCRLIVDDTIDNWDFGLNKKQDYSDIVFHVLQILELPKNYKLQFLNNGTYTTVEDISLMRYSIYDAVHTAGKVCRFRLVPAADYLKFNIGLEQEIKDLQTEKDELEKSFFTKYSYLIQEGTWESSDYIDPELYYLDALQVSFTSAQPKISYQINVAEISEIEGYENYLFFVGDRTYIEDTEFFGWEVYSENGATTQTPIKEEVVVSQVEWHLDEPENNLVTVQNYKTQFEDLFQRISATVQSVQYNQANYSRAASILDSNGRINAKLLINSLNAISADEYELASAGIVKATDEGLVVRDLTNSGNLIIIKSRGIERSEDGGQTWHNLISAKGVNTEQLISGSVDTQKITIMDGNNPNFRWDKSGLSAYGYNPNGGFDLKTFVRFDKFGLYGIQNNETYVASTIEDIKNNAQFGLTWDGFFIKNKYRNGYISISSTDDIQVVTNGQERIKIGLIEQTAEEEKYGITIKNSDGVTVFETDDNGDLNITGTIHATAGEFSGKVTANEGQIGGFTISNNELYNGEFGEDGSVWLSPGYNSQKTIANISGNRTWAIAAGRNFGVTTKGVLYATEANISGTINAVDGNFSGYVNARGGRFEDEIIVGYLRNKFITINATADEPIIASSDYIHNTSSGWMINGYGDAIFNNVSVRGAIKTAVFEYGEIEAVGGAFLFRPSSSIKDAWIPTEKDLENPYVTDQDILVTVENSFLFKQNEWVKVSNINSESGVGDILNDGGLTHVYRIKNKPGDNKYLILEGARKDFDSIDFYTDEDVYAKAPGKTEIVQTSSYSDIYYYQIDRDYENDLGNNSAQVYYKEVDENTEEVIINDVILEKDKTYYFNYNLTPYVKQAKEYTIVQTYIYMDAVNEDEDSSQATGKEITQIVSTKVNYIGNLSIVSPNEENTGEHFLLASIVETIDGVEEIGKTRIYLEHGDFNCFFKIYKTQTSEETSVEDLIGGSLISFGFYNIAFTSRNVDIGDNPHMLGLYELINEEYVLTNDTQPVEGKIYYREQYEEGHNNYGIGINSSDNYVNLPERAISLFETVIHPTDSVKVTYDYKGILGTLPRLGDEIVNSPIYNNNMAGTQGIFTNNMYIGDNKQYIAFYTDDNGDKQLKINAKQIVYEVNDDTGEETTWEEHIDEQIPIRVEIESSAGNIFLRENIQTTLTCNVFKGNENITNQVIRFTWIKYDKNGNRDETWVAPIPSGRTIIIGPADVASKAIFKCEVEF